jgi:ATP-dependent Clp protease protease subunit
VETVILPLLEFEKDNDQSPVKLIISTVGGSVSDGLILCNIIDNYKKPLEIYVYGYACSMGTIILCSGNKNPNVTKYCYPFSFGLFHAGYSAIEGESLSVEDQIEFNKKTDTMIRDYVVSHTNITAEEYKANERRQWYLNAREMKEKGLIDIIIGEVDSNE